MLCPLIKYASQMSSLDKISRLIICCFENSHQRLLLGKNSTQFLVLYLHVFWKQPASTTAICHPRIFNNASTDPSIETPAFYFTKIDHISVLNPFTLLRLASTFMAKLILAWENIEIQTFSKNSVKNCNSRKGRSYLLLHSFIIVYWSLKKFCWFSDLYIFGFSDFRML